MVVLLVEDDAAVRTFAAASLQEEHFYVLQASDGDEALRVARSHESIDLLLTDVEMGDGLNGIELGSRILAERPGLPVLVMSGFPDAESMAAEKGMPFLAKPVHTRQPETTSTRSAGVQTFGVPFRWSELTWTSEKWSKRSRPWTPMVILTPFQSVQWFLALVMAPGSMGASTRSQPWRPSSTLESCITPEKMPLK
jgi:CheY-like chemotaxis protein